MFDLYINKECVFGYNRVSLNMHVKWKMRYAVAIPQQGNHNTRLTIQIIVLAIYYELIPVHSQSIHKEGRANIGIHITSSANYSWVISLVNKSNHIMIFTCNIITM